MSMATNNYKKPPITESVIEIRFAHPHNKSKLDKFIKKNKRVYANYQELNVNEYKVDLLFTQQNIQKTNTEPKKVHRFSSEDMTKQLLLNESSFVVSQLAPYCGWDDFIDRFIRDWTEWKNHLGFNEIKQIGVRYINRIDIPVSDPILDFSLYVNIYPNIPDILGPNSSYAIQVKIPMNELKCLLSLNTAVVESPLLKHMSLVIDQDIVRATEVPQKDEVISSFLNEIHVQKNNIFESCITDKAREIFNR